METKALFCVDHVVEGDDSMCFRAFRHLRKTVIIDVRAVDKEHRPVGQHLIFSHDLRSFSESPVLRGRLVSDAISTVCLGDRAASLLWKDYVSRRSIERALLRFKDEGGSGGRGVRFAIEFQPVTGRTKVHWIRRAEMVWGDDYEVIDDVLVVGGGGGGSRHRYGKLRRLRLKDDGSFKEKECAICFEEYYGGEDLGRMTSCSHTFHHRCIAKWLQLNTSCPLCRREIDAPMLTFLPSLPTSSSLTFDF